MVLKDATFDTAGIYICVVTVPEIEGMKKNGTLRVNVQGKYAHKYSLSCLIVKKISFFSPPKI